MLPRRPMTKRDDEITKPSLDLLQLSARERVRASWEDQEEQCLFSLTVRAVAFVRAGGGAG